MISSPSSITFSHLNTRPLFIGPNLPCVALSPAVLQPSHHLLSLGSLSILYMTQNSTPDSASDPPSTPGASGLFDYLSSSVFTTPTVQDFESNMASTADATPPDDEASPDSPGKKTITMTYAEFMAAVASANANKPPTKAPTPTLIAPRFGGLYPKCPLAISILL